MSTFTLQELNLPMTADEAIKAIEQHEENTMQDISKQQALAHHEACHQIAGVLNNMAIPQIPPQPVDNLSTPPTLESVINTICTQLQLLTTLITSSATKTQAEDQSKSLQDCVALTLQQADWFKEMVEQAVDKRDFDELVGDVVHDKVCSEVEHYFNHSFDPSDHFDFGDAVSSEVFDRIDDAVRDHIDDAVQEQLEELVAEKLKNVRVVFD